MILTRTLLLNLPLPLMLRLPLLAAPASGIRYLASWLVGGRPATCNLKQGGRQFLIPNS
jgi:hypothetical protein